jgi:hypothetical protein
MLLKKKYQIAFLLSFMLIITLPMVEHFLTEDEVRSSENRLLTQKPIMPTQINGLKEFAMGVDNYFSDQFGFRQNIINTTNMIYFDIFNEIKSKQITVGKNGFIYYNSHNANSPNVLIKSVCNIASLPKSFQNKTKKYFSDFINYSNELGIVTGIAVIPTKSRIYPENLPKLEKDWCTSNIPAWWEKMFQSDKDLKVYFPLKKMLSLKDSMPVYLPNHFHWNGLLPYVLAEDMMKSLWDISPEFELTPQKTKVESDLKTHFKGLHFYDTSFDYDYQSAGVRICNGIKCIDGLSQHYKFGLSYTYKLDNPKTDKKLLILADSFGQYIGQNFIRGFSEVVVIDINNLTFDEQFDFYQWITKTIKPTHMLYLLHDGGIYGRTIKLERLINDLKASKT